jgi:hypothetical protein
VTNTRFEPRAHHTSPNVGLLAMMLMALGVSASRGLAQSNEAEQSAPPLVEEFASLVPTTLTHSLRCRPAGVTSDTARTGSASPLSCGGRASSVNRDEPFVAFVDLDADGRITRFILLFTVGAAYGEHSLPTARLDSGYAAAQAFVGQRLGPPKICRGTPLWRTSRGRLVLTPPQRGHMHSTPSYPPQPPGPEYASWALVLEPGLQLPTDDECEPGSRQNPPKSRPR